MAMSVPHVIDTLTISAFLKLILSLITGSSLKVVVMFRATGSIFSNLL